MSPRFIPKREERAVRKITYQIKIKHRGELSEHFLELLRKEVWTFLGDVGLNDISISRINNGSSGKH